MGAVPQVPSVPINLVQELSNSSLSLSKRPSWLQLSVRKEQVHLINLVNENRIVIVAGHRGCGKSTQIPQVRSSALTLFVSLQHLKIQALRLFRTTCWVILLS